jgi:1,4-alpha-glucan branching enzyme
MKTKLLISIFVMMIMCFSITKADIIIQTTHVTYTPGTEFTIPLNLYGASEEGTPVSAMNIIFTFDTAAVQFLQFMNFNPLVPQNQWVSSGNNIHGTVAANWIEPNLQTVAIPDGTALYNVKFKAKPGATDFTFITIEFLDVDFNEIPATTDDGSYASIQQVVFQVNMRDEAVSPNGIHLAGSFNNWSTTTTTMTATGGSDIYTVTLPLITDSAYFYRFVNGNTNSGYETVPTECGTLANGALSRTILNNGNDSTLLDVCFSSCNVCPPQAVVTFQVDMRDQTVGADGVHLAGSFNNWSTSATAMTLISSSLYSVDLTLPANETHTYKFVNGNSESGYEIVPAECGVQSGNSYNRFVELNEDNLVLPVVCFSYCSACPPQSQITFRVEMNLETIDPSGIHIAGSFNNWDASASLMNNLGAGIYGITIPCIIGSEIEYRFVNGNTSNKLETVPAECGVPSGNDQYNRFLLTPDIDSTLSIVCFSRCSVCPPTHEVTFSVDMAQQTISPDGVHLAGSFNGFDPASLPMFNQGNGVYVVTIDLPENEFITYRFVNGADASGFETVPVSCGTNDGSGTYNRSFTVIEYNYTLDQVCFGECEDCIQPPGQTDVTFNVDMNRENVSTDGVFLAGSFNDWSTTANQMNHIGNNLYSITLTFNEEDILQYRFVNGNSSNGYETVPAECGFAGTSGGLERQIIVPVEDTSLMNVCFSSCSACVSYQVTVSVDMMREVIDPAGVHLAGSFNNWNPSETEMISSGSTVYEATIQVFEGDSLIYRFVNGNQPEKMETVPSECGWIYNGSDFARIVIPTAEMEVDTVCFSWCFGCTVGIEEISQSVIFGDMFPNPTSNSVTIPITLPENCDASFIVRDIMGNPLQTYLLTLSKGYQEVKLDVQYLPGGIYFVQYLIKGDQIFKQTTHKLLISK